MCPIWTLNLEHWLMIDWHINPLCHHSWVMNTLFDLDQKSWIKTNIYLFLYWLMLNNAKTRKMAQNDQKLLKICPLFNIIWQYLTLLDFKKGIRFEYKMNRLTWFDPILKYWNKCWIFLNNFFCKPKLTDDWQVVAIIPLSKNCPVVESN